MHLQSLERKAVVVKHLAGHGNHGRQLKAGLREK
ncbi:hypothetical protein VD0003_g10299 [Verticillium dahliae]|nr:hypothetical protein VD0003_g10299 [Verticillium dahliae]